MLTYEQKVRIWKHCSRDWGNGTNKRTPYKPFKAAVPIHKSMARFLIIAAGNRFAKSLIASMEAVAMMTVPGQRIWICGPSYKVCGPEFEYIEYALTKTDVWRKVIIGKIKKQLIKLGVDEGKTKEEMEESLEGYNYTNHISVLKGPPASITIDWPDAENTIVEQKSYNADWSQLEGYKVSMIIFSEGSRVPKILFEKHLRKRLSDLYGRVIIPATPKGRDSFMYPAFRRGLKRELVVDIDRINRKVNHIYRDVEIDDRHVSKTDTYSESYETFQHPAFDNPYYNVDDYNAEIREMFEGHVQETIFKERNFGTFESLSGNYFMGIKEDAVFVDSFELPENVTCYRTIDPGRAGKACCLWVAVQPWEGDKFRYIVYRELYMDGLWVETLSDMVKRMTSEEIFYTVVDRQATQKKFDRKDSVFERMKEKGIKPLRAPEHGMLPHTTIERYNYWLPDIKDNRVIIFKDQCPNFEREILELEYAAPELTKTGHQVKHEKLASSDVHALDAFTYLRYFNPRHVLKSDIEKERKEALAKMRQLADPMSIQAVMNGRSRRPNLGILSLMGE